MTLRVTIESYLSFDFCLAENEFEGASGQCLLSHAGLPATSENVTVVCSRGSVQCGCGQSLEMGEGVACEGEKLIIGVRGRVPLLVKQG